MIVDKKPEPQFEEVVKVLKSLQQVKAPPYFEANLMRAINNPSKEEKTEKWWNYFLIPRFYVPSAVTVMIIVAVSAFFYFSDMQEAAENPFLFEPTIREDVSALNEETIPFAVVEENIEAPPVQVSGGNVRQERTAAAAREVSAPVENEIVSVETSDNRIPIEMLFSGNDIEAVPSQNLKPKASTSLQQIERTGLNYRVVYFGKEEEEEIEQLRQRIQLIKSQRNK